MDPSKVGIESDAPEDQAAIVVAPEADGVILCSLVPASMNYAVKRLSSVSELLNESGRPALCMLYVPSREEAQGATKLLESKGMCGPTVCIIHDGSSGGSVADDGKPWVRTVSFPLDCFELSSAIRKGERSRP